MQNSARNLDLSLNSIHSDAENKPQSANEESCAEQPLSKKADPTGTLDLTKGPSLSESQKWKY